jgi:hypothetical protein
MERDVDDALAWEIRAFVYAYLAEHARPPTAAECAAELGIADDAAASAYRWLHDHRVLFLEADGTSIRMAWPFSGVPTPYRVYANGRAYWANCAWDMLGIPAALHADARIEAACIGSGDQVVIAVEGGAVQGHGERIHLLVPFARWYADLVHT